LAPPSASRSSLPPHLLATKLSVPPARAQWVIRPRLFDRLDVGLRGTRRVTLIAAPAGFGKTTLLSAWRATPAGSGLPLGWVALDSGDNDPLLFWSYCLAALDTAAPGVGASALALLQTSQPPDIKHVLSHMLNAFTAHSVEQPDRHVALVLEDYHVITAPAIHATLAWLLERLPSTLHLVVLTRADPALPLARLRATGDLTELHADDLRFTPEEVAAFLNQTMGLALTAADLAALEARTEGWIAGLQLAALALQGHPDRASFIHTFTGTNRYIVDYLAAEVLEHQARHVQTFLLHTAILDRLCGPLCAAVLGPAAPAEPGMPAMREAASQSQLEALERANLFVVPLDADRQWYRYHHLFADVLRQRLTRTATPAEIAALHERASVWYEANGLVAGAVQHALLLPDGLRAAQLIERHGLKIIVGGQTQTALGWLGRLPETLQRSRPYLGILHALALLFTNDLEGAEARLQDTEACIGPDTSPADVRFIRGNVAAIRANMATYTGDLAACAAYGEQVLALLPESEVIARTTARTHIARRHRVSGDVTLAAEREAMAAVGPIRATGNRMATLTALINVARLRALQGRLRAAAATYEELVPVAGGPEELRTIHGGLPYFVGLGELHYEWNELERAGELLTHAIAKEPGTLTTDGEYVLLGHLALARLQQVRGERDRAHSTLVTATDLARRRGFAAHLVTRVAAVQAHFALAAGNLRPALAWAEASGLTADDVLSFTREPEYLVVARVWIAQAGQGGAGDFLAPALHLLGRLMADATAKERGASVLEILLVRAQALAAGGDRPGALAILEQALAQAAPEGYIRRFVDEGPALWGLLREVDPAAIAGAPGYVSLLLAAIAAEPNSGPGDIAATAPAPRPPDVLSAGLYEPLTERELEVLRLIAAGRSNAQVAQALVIALSTVKTHTNSIFGKLGVTSRTQAIARAHELRLL
jgi:LuxR family transcriptional regulator, maltose regulon positive regulatory protein